MLLERKETYILQNFSYSDHCFDFWSIKKLIKKYIYFFKMKVYIALPGL